MGPTHKAGQCIVTNLLQFLETLRDVEGEVDEDPVTRALVKKGQRCMNASCSVD